MRKYAPDVLALRAQGKTYPEIGSALGLSPSQVREAIDEATAETRERISELADERMVTADARIEWLLDKVSKLIAEDQGFDEKKYKVAIALLERQARLLGYDRRTEPGAIGGNWLDGQPPSKLRQIADDLGLKLPDAFGKRPPGAQG